MTRTIRAHFDGHVIVPDEPLDLPAGEPLEVALRSRSNAVAPEHSPSKQQKGPYSDPASPPQGDSLADLADWIENLPPLPRGSLPTDLAAQHDHYLYGTPKRP